MSEIRLSTNDHDEIVGAVYDIIESKSGVELTNDHYDIIEEAVIDLVERLNEG